MKCRNTLSTIMKMSQNFLNFKWQYFIPDFTTKLRDIMATINVNLAVFDAAYQNLHSSLPSSHRK